MPPLVSLKFCQVWQIGEREQKFLRRMYDDINQPKVLVSKACKTICIEST